MIGHNGPPTGIDAHKVNIGDLIELANGIVSIETPEQDQQADKILSDLKAAEKAADEARKEAKRPHDEAAALVQAEWKPVLTLAKTGINHLGSVLTPYRAKIEARRVAEAEQLRLASIEAQTKAQAALQSDDLETRALGEALLTEARIQSLTANKLDRAKKGLRTNWRVQIDDVQAFAKWVWNNRRDDLEEALQGIANALRTARPDVPGIKYVEERKAA